MRWICLILLSAGTAAAAIVPVAESAAAGGGASVTTAGIDTTGATLLVARVGAYSKDATTCTLADSKSNFWRHASDARGDGLFQTAVWYAYDRSGPPLATGLAHTATITCGTARAVIVLTAYSGSLTTADPLDRESVSSATSQSGTVQTGSITPTQNEDLLVTVAGGFYGSNSSISSPFSIRKTYSDGTYYLATADQVQSTAQTAGPTWTITGGFHLSAAIVSFRTGAMIVLQSAPRRIL